MNTQFAVLRRKARGLRWVSVIALAVASLIFVASPASAAKKDGAGLEKSILLVGMTWSGYVEYPTDDNGYEWSDKVTANSLCTGWFVSKTAQIVTAGHCVDPEEGKTALIDQFLLDQDRQDLADEAESNWAVEGKETGSPIDRIVRVIQPTAVKGAVITTPTIAQVVDFQKFDDGDFTLLKVAGTSKTPALTVARSHPKVGTNLTAIGFPARVDENFDPSRIRASFKSGTASSQQVGTNGISGTEVNADISPGMSGGPTVDSKGGVLGVNSYLITSTAQNFNFITDTDGLRTFLDKNNVKYVLEAKPIPKKEGFNGVVVAAIIAGVIVLLTVIAVVLLLLRRKQARKTRSTFIASPPQPEEAPSDTAPLSAFRSDPDNDGQVLCSDCGARYPYGTKFCSKDGKLLEV